jgi:hypothetical protein
MTHAWHADPGAVRDAGEALRAALARWASSSRDPSSLACVLGAIGHLVTLDGTESVSWTPFALDRDAIVAVLDREEMGDALEDCAVRLRTLLANEDDEPDGDRQYFGPACAALLEARDRAERELLGAALVLGCAPETLEGRSAARAVFDEVVRPESWRLVELGELRQAALAKLAPRVRARFWWWSSGAGVDPAAVAAMSSVAQLVARFPNARARFESLVRAQSIWDAPARTGGERPVVTLRTWLARRSRPSDPGASVPLAAAGEGEQTVLETPELQLSFEAPSRLIVDLLADRRSDERPSLRASSGLVLEATPVANTNERFAFELPAAILDDAKVTLSVPLRAGDLAIDLPEPDTA